MLGLQIHEYINNSNIDNMTEQQKFCWVYIKFKGNIFC